MSNELVSTEAAALAAQVAEGSVELVKAPSAKGVVIASAIGVTTTVGGAIGAFFVGKKIGKKKAEEEFEDRVSSAVEEYLEAKGYQVVYDEEEKKEETAEG